jgi:ribosome-binding factor A
VFDVPSPGERRRAGVLFVVREIMRAKKPYHKRKPARQQIEQLCTEAWSDDGVDPRFPERPAAPKVRRKALQLCSQVKHALDVALAAECADPLLQALSVIDVQPAPNSARLLVLIGTPTGASSDEVTVHLSRAGGKLRCEVAAAINRKKVPELVFCVVAPQTL